ncbi:MAG: PD-(D/E)XK nuclease family protein [Thermodesulfobacteriota bacterium]
MRTEKINEIIELISEGALVLTVNKRLARTLTAAFDRRMAEAGPGAWPTPEVLPMRSWLAGVWNAGAEGTERPALDPLRSKVLWEKVLTDDRARRARGGPALSRQVIDLSYRAYGLVREYAIEFPPQIYLTAEAAAFKRWASEYERRLGALGFVDGAEAAAGAARAMNGSGTTPPPKVVVAGFDELTPLLASVVEALRSTATEVIFWPKTPPAAPAPDAAAGAAGAAGPAEKTEVLTYPDVEAEVAGTARSIREMLVPGMRVGVIVPELSRYRGLIRRVFSEELDPASVLPGSPAAEVFNISLGSPLSEEPLAAAALDVISIGRSAVPAGDLFGVLSGPYVYGAGEGRVALASLDFAMRADNRASTTLAGVAERLKEGGAPGWLTGGLDRWLAFLDRSEGRREGAGFWATEFSALLKAVGFAERLSLASREYQARESLYEVLDGFASLDDITGKVSRRDGAELLTTLARGHIHQPETGEAPVQVLGLLESAGLFFDHVFLLGCHEYAMPSPAAPNPFIPVFTQKEKGTPGSSHTRELWLAAEAAARISESTEALTVSFPERADDRPVGVSPLFRAVEAGDGAAIPGDAGEMEGAVGASLREALFRASGDALEPMPTEAGVPVTPEEREAIRGRMDILQDQSLCPFKAFAAHRLGADEPASTEPGLTAMRRGTIVHEALGWFWEKTRDSKGLKEAISRGRLEKLIATSVAYATRNIRLDPPLSKRYLDIERERVKGLLAEWLELEAARPDFTVLSIERRLEIEAGALRLRARYDRVDEVEGGGRVLMDYKTGRISKNGWIPPRPTDPQLPVYATAESFDAVAFAGLRPGECGFTGVARAGGILPGVKALEDDGWREKLEANWEVGTVDWTGLMALWKETAARLAAAFLEGAAEVDPNPGPSGRELPCKWCGFMGLCRVFEMDLSGGAGEEEEDDDDR